MGLGLLLFWEQRVAGSNPVAPTLNLLIIFILWALLMRPFCLDFIKSCNIEKDYFICIHLGLKLLWDEPVFQVVREEMAEQYSLPDACSSLYRRQNRGVNLFKPIHLDFDQGAA